MKTGNIFFRKWDNHITFLGKYANLPLPISKKAWRTRCTGYSSEHRYRFTIVRQMAPLPSGLTAAMENDVIAAI